MHLVELRQQYGVYIHTSYYLCTEVPKGSHPGRAATRASASRGASIKTLTDHTSTATFSYVYPVETV